MRSEIMFYDLAPLFDNIPPQIKILNTVIL